jgi:hypothetical protein
MSISAAIIRSAGEDEATSGEEKLSCSSSLNEREINNIFADIRAIRQTQDTHFRTLVGYILGAALTVITVISGFGIAILSKLH